MFADDFQFLVDLDRLHGVVPLRAPQRGGEDADGAGGEPQAGALRLVPACPQIVHKGGYVEQGLPKKKSERNTNIFTTKSKKCYREIQKYKTFH